MSIQVYFFVFEHGLPQMNTQYFFNIRDSIKIVKNVLTLV